MSDDIRHKHQLLQIFKRRLYKLEHQEAFYGSSVDPYISMEIEDTKAKISELENIVIQPYQVVRREEHDFTEGRHVVSSDMSVETDMLVDKLQNLIQQCHINNSSMCLIFFDIDRLYGINLSFGIQVGDMITGVVENFIKKSHSNDLTLRWAGDEFVIGIEGIKLSKAKQHADSLRRRIKSYNWNIVAQDLYVSASFGVSQFNGQELATDWLIRTIHGCKVAKRKENSVCLAPEILSRTASRNPLHYIS